MKYNNTHNIKQSKSSDFKNVSLNLGLFILVIFILIILNHIIITKILNNGNIYISLIFSFILINTCCLFFKQQIELWLFPPQYVFDENYFFNNKKFNRVSNIQKLNYVIREMKKQKYDLHNLFEISVHLISIFDYKKLIKSCMLAIIGQLKANAIVIFLKSGNNGELYVPTHFKGSLKKQLKNFSLHQSDPIISYFEKKNDSYKYN